MSEEQEEFYYKVRIKTDVNGEKAGSNYIIKARAVSEADAKIKIHVRKIMMEYGVENYLLDILSITNINVVDYIA
jgi:hypothetical protein